MRKISLSLIFLSLVGAGYLEISSRIEGRYLDIPDTQTALLVLDCAGADCPGKPLINGDSLPSEFQPLYQDILETSNESYTLHFFEIGKSGLNAFRRVSYCLDNQFSSTDQMWGKIQFLDGSKIGLSFLTPSWGLAKLGFFRYSESTDSYVPCGISSRLNLFWFATSVQL